MNGLDWLQNWYTSHLNGEWEDYYGIKLSTLDNPGWMIEVDLLETELETREFEEVSVDNGEADWIFCKVENGKYVGGGDPTKLNQIIEIFKRWAESRD